MHHDPFMPLAGGYYSFMTGQSTWHHTDAAGLQGLLTSDPPEFRTILGRSARSLDDLSAPETAAIAYHGAAYFDFDSESIEECIPQFQAFLNKLREKGVDLNQVRLYATGGRGFHVEVPMGCFIPKPPPAGVVGLPHIYREMAHALYVDLLDLRVYSAKLGRMWRTPNWQRDNGHYKVPISTEDAMAMTAESYSALTSAPRPFPSLAPAAFSPNLGLLYSQAKDRTAAKAQRKRSAKPSELGRRFRGTLPPSVAALCQGRFPARRGWNEISLQLAILAHEVSIEEDALVAACRGLIATHAGDGTRYGTPARREVELRRMFAYTEGNSAYQCTAAGLRSILPMGLRCNDFRGL